MTSTTSASSSGNKDQELISCTGCDYLDKNDYCNHFKLFPTQPHWEIHMCGWHTGISDTYKLQQKVLRFGRFTLHHLVMYTVGRYSGTDLVDYINRYFDRVCPDVRLQDWKTIFQQLREADLLYFHEERWYPTDKLRFNEKRITAWVQYNFKKGEKPE